MVQNKPPSSSPSPKMYTGKNNPLFPYNYL